ncbi:hypothetical protein [Cylindrospermum sp. FACHB-282]|uniref:hypothetical protein n=1 Tax=Cylindrospermum sp. FACHB-282 TaxID=2692794 RepID=UPI00168507C4|nr:hypothetical protein [Cylindrospermum sp. FACHB-282]MBD2388816.1 hypothetical protein [Cylindrospermum sp. FACHB-282]
MTVTVETFIKELERAKDKQAKVIIEVGGSSYDIDKIELPGKDADYVVLAIEASGESDDDAEDSDDED